MTLMQRRRALMAAQGNGGLPADYQRVAWIGFDGKSYIHYGEITLQNPGFAVDFEIAARSYNYGPHLIGSKANLLTFIPRYVQNGVIVLKGQTNAVFPNFATNTRYVVTLKNETATLNGVDYHVTAGETTTGDLYIGLYAGDIIDKRFWFNGKIFGDLVLLNGTAIAVDFVPCYRKADGVIGMYDLISKTFFTNAGTGTFTKGADVI